MSFSVGLLDTLFGKRITLEIPDSNGNIVRRSVTEKWYQLVQNKTVSRTDHPVVKVHLLDMFEGYRIVHWVVGRDIEENTMLRFMNEETGDLYAFYYFELDEPKLELISKKSWDLAFSKFFMSKQASGQSIQGI